MTWPFPAVLLGEAREIAPVAAISADPAAGARPGATRAYARATRYGRWSLHGSMGIVPRGYLALQRTAKERGRCEGRGSLGLHLGG